MSAFKNQIGDVIFCKVDDPRVLSGEYKGCNFGKSNYIDKDGSIIQLYTNDARVLSGEVKNIHAGKIVSQETREKLSKAKKGIVYSQETREKLSKAKKGVKKSKDHVKKVTESIMKNRRENDTTLFYFKNIQTGECVHCSRSSLEDRIGNHLRPLFNRNPPYKKCRGWCLITSDEFTKFIDRP